MPEDGTGWGYQLEGFAVLSGDRCAQRRHRRPLLAHADATGFTHFEGHVVGFMAFPQPVDWKTDNFGVFVQTSVKFGPYPVIGRN